MATEKQIAANRLNGLKGGVKTEKGKAIVRLNAVTHGLLSNEALLKGENRCLLNEIRNAFLAALKPVGELETLYVERIVSSTWRLRRAMNIEVQYLKNPGDYIDDPWLKMLKYETAIERQLYRACQELERLQQSRLESSEPPEPQPHEDISSLRQEVLSLASVMMDED